MNGVSFTLGFLFPILPNELKAVKMRVLIEKKGISNLCEVTVAS